MLSCKEKLNKKNKIGAAFTDDGFVMGKGYSHYFKLFKEVGETELNLAQKCTNELFHSQKILRSKFQTSSFHNS